MIERVAMGFLNDYFRLHPGEIGELPDEGSLSPVRIPASPD